ncbi:sulfite exporter TauE/SafE family protein [Tissierella creatinophila]|uniref:Probable membrane transporter protein n=1 Tax=Tissierella creatinophila DSM 6911 TaxID=1123403 RepID=A0A1U7M6A6_TISCR|nr:sulfite exporter TauE/SafE family protein [Tissierella creatinophila]OLS02853.1 sulfite exporter TauE/SafE [Tissierella creatinophila DSM 6911]
MSSLNLKLISIGIIAGIINGFFGSGGGIIVVIGLVHLIQIEDYKAHATAISIILPLSIVSTIIYLFNNKIPIKITILTMIGGVAGSFIGAKTLDKIPVSILRKIFGGVIIYSALRMFIQ